MSLPTTDDAWEEPSLSQATHAATLDQLMALARPERRHQPSLHLSYAPTLTSPRTRGGRAPYVAPPPLAVAALLPSAPLRPPPQQRQSPVMSVAMRLPLASSTSITVPAASSSSSPPPPSSSLSPPAHRGHVRAPSLGLVSSPLHLGGRELVTTTSTQVPRFDPTSPQMVSTRPMPKVMHRATSISGPAGSGATGAAVASTTTPTTNSPPLMVKRTAVPNVAAALGGLDRHKSLGEPSRAPLSLPALDVSGHTPVTPSVVIMVTPTRETGSAELKDGISPAPSSPNISPGGTPTSSTSPHPSPTSPSNKRAHQSWSVPARGSINGGPGQSGFSSSSFRPTLPREIYAQQGGQTSPTHRVSASASLPSNFLLSVPQRDRSESGSGYSRAASPSNAGFNSPLSTLAEAAPTVELAEVRLHIDPPASSGSSLSVPASPTSANKAAFVFSPPPTKPTLRPASPSFGGGSVKPSAPSPRPRERAPSKSQATEAKALKRQNKHRRTSSLAKAPPKPTVASTFQTWRHALITFPTRLPYSKSIALVLFHPIYLALVFLLSLFAIFALDFTLAFFGSDADRPCDILLLVTGAWWCLELALLSVALPGYLLSHFWWWMDVLSIVSLVVDVSLLRGLGMDLAPFERASDVDWASSSDGVFRGLAHSGYGKLWLFLHLARLVRLFKYFNGLEALSGSLSLSRCFERLAWRGRGPAPAASESSFHKPSTLGLHLTNRLHKQLTLVFLAVTLLFSLLAPLPVAVNNNPGCLNGSVGGPNSFTKFSSMEQWSISYMDSNYAKAVRETTTTADLTMHPFYHAAVDMAQSLNSSFGENLLLLSLATTTSASSALSSTATSSIILAQQSSLAGMRSIEVARYSCGGSVLLLSNAGAVHDTAVWNILLLVFLFLVFALAQASSAFVIARSISHPLERMTRVVRKMAGTVLFLQNDSEQPKDAWDMATSPPDNNTAAGGAGDRRILSSSASSWYLSNGPTRGAPFSAALLGGWVAPVVPSHYEFDLVEELVTKMSSVFDLLPGGLSSLLDQGGAAGGEDKARRVMVGSKRTEIKTRDSLLTIDVVERPINQGPAAAAAEPRGDVDALGFEPEHQDDDEFISSSTLLNPAGISQQLALSTMQNPAGRASIHHSLPADSELRFESHPELRSLENLLDDPFAAIHFKQYLHRKFCQETIAFYEQVAKYKARMQSWAFRIYHQFVVAGAPNEINIHSAQRLAISSDIFHPSLDIFNLAQKEVYKLLKNNFNEFLVSQACYQYLASKQHKQLTIKVGQEHIS